MIRGAIRMPVSRGRRAAAAAVTATAVLAVLAACDSGGGTTTVSSGPSTATASSSTVSTPASSDVPTTPSATASTTPPATGSPTTPNPSVSTSTAPALAACASLGVTVTRVPGAAGVTYGLVSVTSRGTAPCALPGVPSLRLLDSARAPMTATADGAGGPGLTLAPGAVASTLLEDRSADCQANTRSTYVEVRPTTAAATVVLALALPPCTLSVKPFVAGTSPNP